MHFEVIDGNSNLPTAYILGLENQFRGHELATMLNVIGFRVVKCYAKKPNKQNQKSNSLRNLLISRQLSLAEIGCLESHNRLMMTMCDAKEKVALIFEDDALLTISFVTEISNILTKFQQITEPSILNLSYSIRISARMRNILANVKLRLSVSENCILQTSIPTYGTMAYIINYEAAALATQNSIQYLSPADWPAEWSGGVNFFTTYKPVVLHPALNNDLVLLEHSKPISSRNTLEKFKRCKGIISDLLKLYSESCRFKIINPFRITYYKLLNIAMHSNSSIFNFFYKIETFPFYDSDRWQYFYKSSDMNKL